MKVKDVIRQLETIYPPSYAMEWDHSGLQVGDEEANVRTVLVALDATDEVIDHAAGIRADLIITHHPMLFRPVERVVRQERTGRRILSLAEHGISCYAMHTNFDVAGMADLNSRELGLRNARILSETTTSPEGFPEGLGRVGELEENMTLMDFAREVRDLYQLPSVRIYGELNDTVQTVAVCSGSGKSLIRDAIDAGADVFVTGDIDYHTAIDAVADGLNLIDAGHYGTEFGFISHIQQLLKEQFPDLTVIAERIRSPYTEV